MATVVLVMTSLGAIGYAGLQLRHEREYRAVANLEKQLAVFLGESFGNARRRLALARLVKVEEPGSAPDTYALAPWQLDDPPVSAFEVLDFYEHLALLVKKGHLDLYDIWHTFYEWAQPVYVDMQTLIESPDSPYRDHYSDLQRMLGQMDDIQRKKMRASRTNHRALWTPERIIEHYRYEIEAIGTPRLTIRQRASVARRDVA